MSRRISTLCQTVLALIGFYRWNMKYESKPELALLYSEMPFVGFEFEKYIFEISSFFSTPLFWKRRTHLPIMPKTNLGVSPLLLLKMVNVKPGTFKRVPQQPLGNLYKCNCNGSLQLPRTGLRRVENFNNLGIVGTDPNPEKQSGSEQIQPEFNSYFRQVPA